MLGIDSLDGTFDARNAIQFLDQFAFDGIDFREPSFRKHLAKFPPEFSHDRVRRQKILYSFTFPMLRQRQ